jgi:arylsulfatase A-like enzyme
VPSRQVGRPASGLFRHFSAVFAVYLAGATVLACGAAHVLHGRSAGAPPPHIYQLAAAEETVPRYLVLMVLDGARPDYFGLTPLPHADALRASGTQYSNAVSGMLEAETPSGHATIATGSRPDRNGILGFDWANDNDRYSLFDPAKMGALEQILQDSGSPTLASLYKRQYPGAKVVALSGHKYYAAAPLGGPAADAIIYYQGSADGHYVPVAVPGHTPPASLLNDPSLSLPSTHLPNGAEDGLATKMALAVTRTMHPRMLLINYPEFDWPVGHVDGGSADPQAVITLMKNFDADLGRIEAAYQQAGILDQTLFVITADHGMMPISRFVPSTVITNAVAAAGTTAPDIAANSGDYIWLADASKAQAVAQTIVNTHDPGIQSAYYLTTAGGAPHYAAADGSPVDGATEAANQYLLGSLLNGHEPAVVVFGVEGASFSDPSTNWKGDHGGNSWQSQHVPLILAGPGIRAGVASSAPAQLEDLAPTVLTDMGVKPTGMAGRVLTDALEQPGTAATQARKAEIGEMASVLDALSGEDVQGAGGS